MFYSPRCERRKLESHINFALPLWLDTCEEQAIFHAGIAKVCRATMQTWRGVAIFSLSRQIPLRRVCRYGDGHIVCMTMSCAQMPICCRRIAQEGSPIELEPRGWRDRPHVGLASELRGREVGEWRVAWFFFLSSIHGIAHFPVLRL